MTSLNNNEKYVLIETIMRNKINHMLDYQRINNINNCCITNTQLLYETARETLIRQQLNPDDIKIIPVIVLLGNNIGNNNYIITGHLVVLFRENIYECSYDVYKNRNNKGFKYIKAIHELFRNDEFNIRDEDKKRMIEDYICFDTKAKHMNGGGRLVESSRGVIYLHNMRNYVDRF